MTTDRADHEARLTRVESALENLVHQVAESHKDIRDEVKDLAKSIKETSDNLSKVGRANWGLLISAAVLCMTIISSLGYLTFTPMRERLYELTDDVDLVRGRAVGNSERLAIVETYAEQTNTLRAEQFKRIDDEILKLDTKLQKEMVDMHASRDVADRALKDQLTIVWNWQNEFGQKWILESAALSARVANLERQTP